MTANIQFHVRVRVHEDELDDFLAVARRFVETVKSEPGADSCACYVDRETRTVSFFEIFRDVEALLAHFEDPKSTALNAEMALMVEEFERIELFGNISPDVLDDLAEDGIAIDSAREHAAFFGRNL